MYVTLLAPRKPERGSRSGPPLLTWEKTDMRRFATLRNAACALAGAAMLTLAGCGSEAPPPPPPPEVGIVTIRAQPVTNVITLPGRGQAVRTAEVRARVDGIVQRRLYEEGTDVRAGQAPFAIDPPELRAGYNAVQDWQSVV